MKMSFIGLMALLILVMNVTGELAIASQKCAMTYETFEGAIPHIDMENCPGGNVGNKAFCRASVGGDRVYVFYFADEGDECLMEVKSFDEDGFTLSVKSK